MRDPDLDLYLSEIDGPKIQKIKSVIVKPNPIKIPCKKGFIGKRQNHRIELKTAKKKPNNITIAGTKAHVHPHQTAQSTQIVATKIAHTAKSFESRGTQTERSGPCKCARAVQKRNKQRRATNTTNKQIVDSLERLNVVKFN